MCRSKSDENYPGGRRCPAHAKLRIAYLNRKMEAINSEITETRSAFENAVHEAVQNSIKDHLERLAQEKMNLTRELRQEKNSVEMSDVTIKEWRAQADNMTDVDEKNALLAKADLTERKLAKQRDEFKQNFMKQKALMDALHDYGIPMEDREALLESFRSDTGSSNLRSFRNYDDAEFKADEVLYLMQQERNSLEKSIENDATLTYPERLNKINALETQWKDVIANQKARVKEIQFNKYQTLKGLDEFNKVVENKAAKYERKIEEAKKIGDMKTAKMERMNLAQYAGVQESTRQAIIQSRNVRLADRKIRDAVIPRIKQIMKENFASEKDTQKVIEAYKSPVGYFAEKQKVDHWDEKVTVLMHLTGSEAKAFASKNKEEVRAIAIKPPTLPKNKTLNELHSEFVRHHDGGAHRQTTVQGVKRNSYKQVHFKRRELAIVDGYASTLGMSRSSYLRGQLATESPFSLLNDRSEKTRGNMKLMAKDFLSMSRKESLLSA
ncbi:hypothetical protein [Glutamicibacter ardleyensis]|uniref:hypothetical protein n=1 Tax=Glutamicibacter ardleyensis TaxID=225894 RepID=UPI003FD37027